MVNTKNIKTKRLSKKLDYKLRGKFEIEKLCGTNAYGLKLPPLSGKIHLLFHVLPFGTLPPEYHPGKTLANAPTSGPRAAGVYEREDQDYGDKRWSS